MVKKYILAGIEPHISTQHLSTLSFQIHCSVSSWVLKEPFIRVKIKLVWEFQSPGKLPDLELLNPNTGSLILSTLEFPAVESVFNCLIKIVMQLVFKKIKTTEKSMRISGPHSTHIYYKQEELLTEQSFCI